MMFPDLANLDFVEIVLICMLLVYLPFAAYQMYLIIYSMVVTDEKIKARKRRLDRSNNVIVVITTNGMATDVVEKIIRKVGHYNVASKIFVLRRKGMISCIRAI